MCNCRTELQQQAKEYFAKQEPTAENHKAELQGYGIGANPLKLMVFMPLELTADFPLKKGGVKRKTKKSFITFNYCPFCGEKIGDE